MKTDHSRQLDALGDPTRRAIFERLAEGPCRVGVLAREVPVSRPAVSQHLRVLKEAGLVTDRPDGQGRLYQHNPEGIRALQAHFAESAALPRPRSRPRARQRSLTASRALPLVDGWAALADPTRRKILGLVVARPRAVGELAELLPITRPAVSQHLKLLKTAGLVVDRAEGTRRIYRANPTGLEVLRGELEQFWNQTLANFKELVEQTQEDA